MDDVNLETIKTILAILCSMVGLLTAGVATLAWFVRKSTPSLQDFVGLERRVATLEQIAVNLPSQRDLFEHKLQMERTIGSVSEVRAVLELHGRIA